MTMYRGGKPWEPWKSVGEDFPLMGDDREELKQYIPSERKSCAYCDEPAAVTVTWSSQHGKFLLRIKNECFVHVNRKDAAYARKSAVTGSRFFKQLPPNKAKCLDCNVNDTYYVRQLNGWTERDFCESCRSRRTVHQLTYAEFIELLDIQQWLCAVCYSAVDIGSAVVDHEHGKCSHSDKKSCSVCRRGILCVGCNHGVLRSAPKGSTLSEIEIYQNASTYLLKYQNK